MSDVLVCAEPEIREEATAFVSKLGGRPQIYSVRALKHWHEKGKWLFVYLKGRERSSTLRSCLREVSKNRTMDVFVYTHPSDDHQAAELGKIIGECRPRRTYIYFDSDEMEEIFHVRLGVSGKDKEKNKPVNSLIPEESTPLRKQAITPCNQPYNILMHSWPTQSATEIRPS